MRIVSPCSKEDAALVPQTPKRARLLDQVGGAIASDFGQREKSVSLARRDAPDRVADVVGDEESAALVEGDADRAAVGVALGAQEAVEDFGRLARRLAVAEGNEDDVVAGERL